MEYTAEVSLVCDMILESDWFELEGTLQIT